MKVKKIVFLVIATVVFIFAEDNSNFLSQKSLEKLTLSQAIEIALQNNPELKAKKSDIKAQEQKLTIAQSGHLPTLGIEGSLSHYSRDQKLIPTSFNGERGEFGSDVFQSSLVLKLPLYMGGKIVADIEANRYLTLAQEHLLVYSQKELVFNIRTLFWSIYSQEKSIDSLLFALETMEKHKKEVILKFELKDVAKVDILKTDVRIADLKQMLEDGKNKLSNLYSLLYVTMGIENSFTINIDRDDMQAKFDHAFIEPQDLYKEALQNRDDYLSFKTKVEALKQEIIIARSSQKPSIGLYGNYGYRNLGDISSAHEITNSFGVTFSMPLYSGGSNEAKVALSYANLQSTQERLHALELKIQNDINNALSEFKSSRKRSKLSKDSIDLAMESLRIEELKYKLGKGVQSDLLDAQTILLNAQTNYAKMVALGHISYARLLYAIGKYDTKNHNNRRNSNVQ